MDIALIIQPDARSFDIALNGPDLLSGGELQTAIIISLFTDRRAEPDDEFEGDDPRGWWGDEISDVEGHKTGSRLWLIEREKQTSETLTRAIEYVQEALAWLVEDGVADAIDVEAEWRGIGLMVMGITVTKGDNEKTYEFVWDQLRAA